MNARRIGKRVLAAAVLFAASAAAFGQPWWNDAWQCRRTVEVEGSRTGIPGDEAAVVEFTTGGCLQPDGRDIRVVASGRTVPHKIVFIGPGDRVTLLFQVLPVFRQYSIYYGNAACEAPKHGWTPQRGLLMETRPYRGGNCRNWKEMQDLIERAGEPYGRGVVDTIFHAHNPFGPSQGFVSKYSGWLYVPKTARYDLAISSASASFLFLDDKLFLQWPNWHRALADGRFHKAIQLTAGLHKIAYHHVQGDAPPVMVMAWRNPGEARFRTMPPEAFLPPLKATLRGYRLRDADNPPDFDWRNEAESFAGGRPYVVMKFSDTATAVGAGRQRLWDFGDGLTSAEPSPSHLYLAPGTYAVCLSYPRGKEDAVCRQRIVVDRDWARQADLEPEDLKETAARVRRYSWEDIDGNAFLPAFALYEELGRDEDILRIAAVLPRRLKDIPDEDIAEAVIMAAKRMREKEKNPDGVVALLRRAERAARSAASKARLAIYTGDVILYDKDRPVAARVEYERVIGRYAEAREHLRMACMRVGDVARQLGDASDARRHYEKALALREEMSPERESLNVAMRALETEDFLRRKLYDAAAESLHLWQWQDPLEKLRGQWSVMAVKLALATGDLTEAVKQAEILLAINAESQYAPELLLLLADARRREGRDDLAIRAVERLERDYPGSPLVKDAEDLLKGSASDEGGADR